MTIDTIAAQLDADRELAYRQKNPSAAVSATVGKAKLFGLMVDRQSVQGTHNYATMTEEEVRFEMDALAAEARALEPGVRQ